jgi:hypothetical protein
MRRRNNISIGNYKRFTHSRVPTREVLEFIGFWKFWRDCGNLIETLEFQTQVVDRLLKTKQMGKSNLQTINLKWKLDRL